MTFDLFLALLASLIIILTVLPFWRVGLWWVRIFDFPCAQLTALGTTVMATWLYGYFNAHNGHVLSVSTGMMPLLAAALMIQGYRIYPYTGIAKTESQHSSREDPEQTLSILAFNVLMTNRNDAEILTLIKQCNPDLILLTEPDHWWERALQELELDYRFTIKKPMDNTYGMLMYSRHELEESSIRFLVEDDVPSFFTIIRLPSGDTVDFYGLHPRPPHVNQDVHERDAELLIVGRSITRRQRPAIVAGDLNDVAWSHTTRLFRRVSGLLDPRIGRGFFNTFPTHLPFFRFPMDHIFHSEHMYLKRLEILNSQGSDHYPIYASFYMTGKQSVTHMVSHDAKKESQEKIVKGLQEANSELSV